MDLKRVQLEEEDLEVSLYTNDNCTGDMHTGIVAITRLKHSIKT